jgi:ATP-dependent helicase/nuclease subunit A
VSAAPMDEARARELDAEARRAAVTEFRAPLVLTAGAGTGKTATLVARVVAWCLGPGWKRHVDALEGDADPHRVAQRVMAGVVAITFTEAAAAEMSERVGQAFEAVAEGGSMPPGLDRSHFEAAGLDEDGLRSRASSLAAAQDSFGVSTIHGWASRLVAAHPFELGLHPAPTIDADGEELERAVRETVEEALDDAYGDPGDEAWLALARRDKGPIEVAAALKRLAERGLSPEVLERDPFSEEPVAELRGALLERVERLHGLIAPLHGELAKAKNARRLIDCMSLFLGAAADGMSTLEELLDAVGVGSTDGADSLMNPNLKGHLHHYARGSFNGTETTVFGEQADAVREASRELHILIDSLTTLDPDFLNAARAVLAPLLRDLSTRLVRRGVLSFDDLLAHADRLLSTDAFALARERRRIDQLLVDEFQDTDERQCRMVRALALEGPEDERPGLFVVGDPKQSIYGFRRADLAAFEGFVESVRGAGGREWPLFVNFRSTRRVLDEVARVVEPVMREEPGVQARFEPLYERPDTDQLSSPPQGEPAVEYRLHLVREPDGVRTPRSAEGTQLDALALAREIREQVDSGRTRYADHALLLRATTDLDQYLEAFRRHAIPYAVARDRSYYRRREVVDAGALVSAILDPTDLLSLVGWLRSPSVGLPDAALYPLWTEGLPDAMIGAVDGGEDSIAPALAAIERAAARVDATLPGLDRLPLWVASACEAVRTLGELRAAVRERPADEFVELARCRTGIEGSESARFLGRFRQANLERFFDELHEALEGARGDLAAVARQIRVRIAEGRDAEEGRPKEVGSDAVQVMTIHGAKGLEFRCVHLGQLHKRLGGKNSRGSLAADVDGYRDAEGRERLAYSLFGAPTLDFAAVEERRKRTETAEQARLLYVALTRARARLTLGGTWSEGRFRGSPSSPSEWIHLFDARRGGPGGAALQLVADESGDPPPWIDVEGSVRVRTFERDERPEPSPKGMASGSTSIDPRRAYDDLRRLRTSRAEAARRSARPLTAQASADAHRALSLERVEVGFDPEAEPEGRLPGGERAAMAVGAVLHRLLEHHRGGGLDPALAEAAAEQLAGQLRGSELTAARERLDALLHALEAGPLLDRLEALDSQVVARELPVLLEPLPEESGADDPVGAWIGTVDLVYTAPESGRLVVADFKSDDVADPALRAARVAAYSTQLTRYARALHEALGLEQEPRRELWWLALGEVEVLD